VRLAWSARVQRQDRGHGPLDPRVPLRLCCSLHAVALVRRVSLFCSVRVPSSCPVRSQLGAYVNVDVNLDMNDAQPAQLQFRLHVIMPRVPMTVVPTLAGTAGLQY
jgi:hypothetical protein